MWVQATVLPDVETRYGGLIVGEVHQVGSDYREQLTIVDIKPGSAFDLAGVQENDVIISTDSIGTFAKKLDVTSGSRTTFTVVPGGQGLPFQQRPSRTITVTAP